MDRTGIFDEFRRSLIAKGDVVLPAGVGLAVWVLIARTSSHPEPWNDLRYWPTMLVAAFVLGLTIDGHARRTGLLLVASGPPAGMLESILVVKNPALLVVAPVLLLLFWAICVLCAKAGTVARGGVDRLALHFPKKPPWGRAWAYHSPGIRRWVLSSGLTCGSDRA